MAGKNTARWEVSKDHEDRVELLPFLPTILSSEAHSEPIAPSTPPTKSRTTPHQQLRTISIYLKWTCHLFPEVLDSDFLELVYDARISMAAADLEEYREEKPSTELVCQFSFPRPKYHADMNLLPAKPAIRRLARRGGVLRIQMTIYDTVREVIKQRLELVSCFVAATYAKS